MPSTFELPSMEISDSIGGLDQFSVQTRTNTQPPFDAITQREACSADASTAEPSPTPTLDIALPLCGAFLRDPRPRRIDWLGDVAFPDARQRRRQPSIFVHLSRVDAAALNDPVLLLKPVSTFYGRLQQGCWVSVGMLPLLRIGDVWSGGRVLQRPDYELETFPEVEISEETTTLVKAGLNKDGSGFLLPLNDHPWHRRATHSYCVEVALSGHRRLLIPCMELIRFYFGSSSRLINRLFTPPLTAEALYVAKEFDRQTGRLRLTLAESMSGASASDIGRICIDPIAWWAAKLIGSSLLKETADAQAIFPQADFPFEGTTTLCAAGKWLSYGARDRTTFIVFNLRSCSHAFPFKALRYDIEQPQPARPRSNFENADGERERSPRPRTTPRSSEQEAFVEQDASRRLASKTRLVRGEPRFPDLLHKPVWRQKTLHGSTEQSIGGAAKVQQVTVGHTDAEHRIRSVDLAIAIVSPQVAPDFLLPIIVRLKRLRRLKQTLLTCSEQDGWTVPITMVHDKNGEIDPRLFIDVGGAKSRLRRVGAFRLQRRGACYCLLLIEANPLHVQRYVMHPNEDVWRTVDRAAAAFLDQSN